tara:strand:+ start:1 stop:1152 length:1152 start_codon:yes stop_codon:yes gene_type:complete
MKIGILKEIIKGENRVSITPSTSKSLISSGYEVLIESGAGEKSNYLDAEYLESGSKIISDVNILYSESDIILKVNAPSFHEILKSNESNQFKSNSIYISFLDPYKEENTLDVFINKKITSFSMNLIPRTTLAQKMDALSSQSNIAGYKAVLYGASLIGKYMPLLMTAAGTVKPAQVMIIGAGVAGLSAVATAKRLGANVEVFDVRPEVKEQVNSLGAKFIEVEKKSDEGVGEGGYAKETSKNYQIKQAEKIKLHIAKSDLVITTALIPGKPAPKIIVNEMVDAMKPGSVIIDLAAENGGNCTLTQPGQTTNYKDIKIIGKLNFPSSMAHHASKLYSKNIFSFLNHVLLKERKYDFKDEITMKAIITHDGKLMNKQLNHLIKEH